MIEIWKTIPNYEGMYEISNFGRVKSLTRPDPRPGMPNRILKERVLKPSKEGGGYLFVGLHKNGTSKLYKIHRLVGLVFVENLNPTKFTDINHIDGDKTNNHFSNLEWCDKFHNMKHAYSLGLIHLSDQRGENNSNAKRIIRISKDGLEERIFNTRLEAAKSINSTPYNVYYASKNNSCHKGYYFKYHSIRKII